MNANTSKQNSPGSHFPDSLFNDLTPREWKVLLLLAEDIPNAEIAEKLCLTPESVKTYRSRIGDKLLVHGRNELGRYARRNASLLRKKYQTLYKTFD